MTSPTSWPRSGLPRVVRTLALTFVVLVTGALPGLADPAAPATPATGATPPARAELTCTDAGKRVTSLPNVAPGTSRVIATVSDETAWQPQDGRVRFTISAADGKTPSMLDNIEVAVCFGWPEKVWLGKDARATGTLFAAADLRTVARTADSVTYEALLPDALWDRKANPNMPAFQDVLRDPIRQWIPMPVHVYQGLGMVPVVHMRVVARSQTPPAGSDPLALDNYLSVGVSSHLMAIATTLAAIAVSWWLLLKWAGFRGVRGDAILKIISNRNGYASLSQFQILLWTFVIGAGLIYVMVLSGSLIDVPNQALALLGISGFSALSAGYKGRRDEQKAAAAALAGGAAPPAGAAPAPPAAAPAAPVAPPAAGPRTPQWSDLVVWDGIRELDITRVQMLAFTVLAASFVAIRIVDTNAIPAIPDGIVLLMGLTNGVYVGGKFTS